MSLGRDGRRRASEERERAATPRAGTKRHDEGTFAGSEADDEADDEDDDHSDEQQARKGALYCTLALWVETRVLDRDRRARGGEFRERALFDRALRIEHSAAIYGCTRPGIELSSPLLTLSLSPSLFFPLSFVLSLPRAASLLYPSRAGRNHRQLIIKGTSVLKAAPRVYWSALSRW